MNNETFNNQINSLYNINKATEISDDNHNFNTISNNNENINKDFKLDLLKIKSIKNFESNIESNNDNSLIPKSYKSSKIIKDKDNNINPFEKLLNDDETHRTIYKNDSTNNQNKSNIKEDNVNMYTKSKPINIKKYYKSHTLKFIDFPKKKFSSRKLSLHKKIKNNNDSNKDNKDIVKEVDESNYKNKLFSTEIDFDYSNIDENPNIVITNNNINNYYKYNNESKGNLSSDNYIKNKNKKYEDPLLIPKEDMIFDEIKKYKCFKYFTQESLNKTGVPFIYIEMNMSPNKGIMINTKKNVSTEKSLNDKKFLQKLIKTGKDKIYLNKRFNKDMNDERKKEILSNVYRITTAPDFFKRIEVIKGKKDRKKLKNYQNNFLKIVKHNISNKYYESLKDKFLEIRNEAEGKYHTNFKFLKEIEKNEENVINNINEICNKYKRYFATKNINKLFVKSIGPRLKLPKIKFIQLAKKDFFSEDEKKNKTKKKHDYINLKNYMNKTNIKFNQNNLGKIQNKDNMFSSTNYNKFNIKSQSCKKYNK